MNPFILLFLVLCARYPETMKVIISLVFLYFLIYSIGGWGFFLIILLSVVFIVIVKIVGTVWNSDDKNNDYKNRISGRNQSIANVMRNDPDVTVRKGDKASGVLPKAYKFFIYKGLKNTKTSRFQDDMINIIFRVSEDFRGIVIEIKNLSRDNFYIKWGSATISDNHVYIDDIPYNDYMSLGKLRPGESVTKTLREKSLSRFFFDEDILRQNCKLTNNAGYVVRIPITLESGKKIRYKFSIVTGRVDEDEEVPKKSQGDKDDVMFYSPLK